MGYKIILQGTRYPIGTIVQDEIGKQWDEMYETPPAVKVSDDPTVNATIAVDDGMNPELSSPVIEPKKETLLQKAEDEVKKILSPKKKR